MEKKMDQIQENFKMVNELKIAYPDNLKFINSEEEMHIIDLGRKWDTKIFEFSDIEWGDYIANQLN